MLRTIERYTILSNAIVMLGTGILRDCWSAATLRRAVISLGAREKNGTFRRRRLQIALYALDIHVVKGGNPIE